MNNFYKNGITTVTADVWSALIENRTNFHWYKNANAAGCFGKTEEDNHRSIRAIAKCD